MDFLELIVKKITELWEFLKMIFSFLIFGYEFLFGFMPSPLKEFFFVFSSMALIILAFKLIKIFKGD